MKLWIDTDTGIDDSTAILIALAAPNVEIVGISCVGGNAHLENVVKNVNRTLLVFGKRPGVDIPIFAGCSKALIQPHMVIPEIHGNDGLGDINNSDFDIHEEHYDYIKNKHAVNALIEYVTLHPNDELVLLTLGPLTNIALAMRMGEQELMKGISKIVVMGGAEDGNGNTSEYAEFNIRCDPEAAQIVFSTFPQDRIVMSSWTLTQKFSFKTKEDLDKYQGNTTNTILGKWIHDTWQYVLDFTHGDMLMADPLASFVTCYPQYITEVEKSTISIVLSGEKIGLTELVPNTNNLGTTTIVKSIDFDKYKEVLMNLMKLR